MVQDELQELSLLQNILDTKHKSIGLCTSWLSSLTRCSKNCLGKQSWFLHIKKPRDKIYGQEVKWTTEGHQIYVKLLNDNNNSITKSLFYSVATMLFHPNPSLTPPPPTPLLKPWLNTTATTEPLNPMVLPMHLSNPKSKTLIPNSTLIIIEQTLFFYLASFSSESSPSSPIHSSSKTPSFKSTNVG